MLTKIYKYEIYSFFLSFFLIIGNGYSQCSNLLTNLAEYWYESTDNCCYDFHPCEDGNISAWDWGDGTAIQIVAPGESVNHCFCPGSYVVNRSITIGNQIISDEQVVVVEDCEPFLEADFEYDIIAFAGCSDPTLCCCSDCETVTVKFTDLSIGDRPIIEWNWSFSVFFPDRSGWWSISSSEQNPTIVFDRGFWNPGNKIEAALTVVDECGTSDTKIIVIKGNC